MNCDDAFEYMTDATKHDTNDLQWHLDMCPRCRRMKETLEPALSLLTVDPLDMSREPVPPKSRVQHLLAAKDTQSATAQAEQPLSQMLAPYPSESSSFRRFTAVAVAALTILAGVLLMSSPGESNDVCLWKHRDGLESESSSSVAVVASCLGCHRDALGTLPDGAVQTQ